MTANIAAQNAVHKERLPMKKLSAIMLKMARTLLRRPSGEPSAEAAHAALLFAHVAWNKALGNTDALKSYTVILAEFEDSNPAFWNEFKQTDHGVIIQSLVALKEQRHPNDKRLITVCGMRDGHVHVQW